MPLFVTVVADIVCPWCFIGHRRLDVAIERVGDGSRVEKTHRPFLLDPEAPPEGRDLRADLRRKLGGDPEATLRRVEDAARSTSIALDFAKIERMPSSVSAHTLLRLAARKRTQAALLDALFTAYFLKGRDIGAPAVLIAIAERQGFDAEEVASALADDAQAEETRRQARLASAEGIRAVPYFLIDGSSLAGAQPVDVLERALRARLGDPT